MGAHNNSSHQGRRVPWPVVYWMVVGLLTPLATVGPILIASTVFDECGGPIGAFDVWYEFGGLESKVEENTRKNVGDTCITLMFMCYLAAGYLVFIGYLLIGFVVQFFTRK